MKKYIAKPDTWFKAGTEVKIIEDYEEAGVLCEGIYIVGICSDFEDGSYDDFWTKQGYKFGDEVVMTEVCSLEEFEIYE